MTKAINRTGGKNSPLNATERVISLTVLDVFGRQADEITRISNVANAIGGKNIMNVDKWNTKLSQLVEPSLFDPVLRGGNAALNMVNINLPEWIEDPRIAESIRNSSLRFARNVNDETFTQLRTELINLVTDGQGASVISRRLRSVFEDKISRGQAETIARSEFIRSQSLGQIEAWKQTGVIHKKVWLASGDACPFCLAMNGKVVGIDENFQNKDDAMTVEFQERIIGMRFGYSEIQSPPLHPNCRCTLTAEIEQI